MTYILYQLGVKTVLLTVLSLIIGGLLALTRCRDNRIRQYCWGMVLGVGLFGAAIPFGLSIPTPKILDSIANKTFQRDSQTNAINPSNSENSNLNAVAQAPLTFAESGNNGNLDPNSHSSKQRPNGQISRVLNSPDFADYAVLSQNSDAESTKNVSSRQINVVQRRILGLVFLIWLSGMIVLLTLGILTRYRLHKELRSAVEPKGDQLEQWRTICFQMGIPTSRVRLCLSEKLGPALVWLSPRQSIVIIPEELWKLADPLIRKSILRHELTHWLNGDLWKTLFSQGTFLLHWFNPMAFWAIRHFEESLEGICDSNAFGHDRVGMRRFIESMLILYETTPRFAFFEKHFGNSHFLRRLTQLRNNSFTKKETKMKTIFLMLTSMLIFSFALTLNFAADFFSQEQTSASENQSASESVQKSEIISEIKPETDQTSNQKATISVKDETGQPVSGATITIKVQPEKENGTTQPNHRILHKTTSNNEGLIQLSLPNESLKENEMLKVIVEKDGYVSRTWVAFSISSLLKKSTITLDAGKPLSGRVVDPDGHPLADVDIHIITSRLLPEDPMFTIPPYCQTAWLETVTDSQGKFRTHVYAEGSTRLVLKHKNFAQTPLFYEKFSGDAGDLVLKKGFRPKITLLDIKGKPVPQIPIAIAQTPTSKNLQLLHVSIFRYAQTDENGVAEFDPIEAGDIDIRIDPGRTISRYKKVIEYDPEIGVFPTMIFGHLSENDQSLKLTASPGRTLTLKFSEPFSSLEDKNLNRLFDVDVTLIGQLPTPPFSSFINSSNSGFDNHEFEILDDRTVQFKGIPETMLGEKYQIVFQFMSEFVSFTSLKMPGDSQPRQIINNDIRFEIDELSDGIVEINCAKSAQTEVRLLDIEGKPVESFILFVSYKENQTKYEQSYWLEKNSNGTKLTDNSLETCKNFFKIAQSGISTGLFDSSFSPENLKDGVYTQKRIQPEKELTLFAVTEDGKQGFASLSPLQENETRKVVIQLNE